MRNLKRALSLTLASVMLLGMMVVGSGAAKGYDDVSETDNVEAIEVLQKIEVMVGDDRGFGPERPVNRAEMAVVMGKLLNLDYNYYSATCPFNDVYDWARGWVGACAANGIVSGRGEGVYDPGATVTAVEAASMLLRALGYFKYQNDYADGFEVSTVRTGTKIGIFDQVGSSATEPMTRNQVAQMVLNALRSGMVEPDGQTINLTTPDGSVYTGKVNYVYVTNNKPFAKAISSVQATSIGSQNDCPIVELGEQLYNGDLRLNNYDNDVFGRPARTWEYKGEQIGTYVKKELLHKTYTEKVTGKDLYDLLTKNTIETYNFEIAIDGADTEEFADVLSTKSVTGDRGYGYFSQDNMVRTNTREVGQTGRGVLTEVYIDNNPEVYNSNNQVPGIVYIAVMNTYLAKATKDYDAKKDEVNFDIYALTNKTSKTGGKFLVKDKAQIESLKVSGENFDIAEIKTDDIVLVRVADNEVQQIIQPEVISETVVSSFNEKDSWLNADGTRYDFAHTGVYDKEALDAYTNAEDSIINMKEKTYDLYLDMFGNVIGVEANGKDDQYVFLTGLNGAYSNISATTARGNVIHMDGTMETVTIDLEKSRGACRTTTGHQKHGLITYADEADVNLSQLNTWCTYAVDKNGVYTLMEVTKTTNSASPVDGLGQFAQDVNTYYDVQGTPGVKEINNKRTSLRSSTAGIHGWNFGSQGTFVYGNDETVYINVKLKSIDVDDDVRDGANDKRQIVDKVDTTIVGIDKVNLEVNELGAADENGYLAPDAEIYTLYKKGDVIGAVTIGDDNGSTATWAYIISDKPSREDFEHDTDSSKAAQVNEWTWYRPAIVNGEKVDLIEISDTKLQYIGANDMLQGQWYEIKTNADGEVRDATPLREVLLDKGRWSDDATSVEFNLNDKERTAVLHDTYEYADGYAKASDGETETFTKAEWLKLTDDKDSLSFKNGTLYTNTDETKGFHVSKNVKVFVAFAELPRGAASGSAADGYGKHGDRSVVDEFDSVSDVYEGYEGVKAALKALDENFVGDLSAVFNAEGDATVIIFNDCWGTYINEGDKEPSKDPGDNEDQTGTWTLSLVGDLATGSTVLVGDKTVDPSGTHGSLDGIVTDYKIAKNSTVYVQNDKITGAIPTSVIYGTKTDAELNTASHIMKFKLVEDVTVTLPTAGDKLFAVHFGPGVTLGDGGFAAIDDNPVTPAKVDGNTYYFKDSQNVHWINVKTADTNNAMLVGAAGTKVTKTAGEGKNGTKGGAAFELTSTLDKDLWVYQATRYEVQASLANAKVGGVTVADSDKVYVKYGETVAIDLTSVSNTSSVIATGGDKLYDTNNVKNLASNGTDAKLRGANKLTVKNVDVKVYKNSGSDLQAVLNVNTDYYIATDAQVEPGDGITGVFEANTVALAEADMAAESSTHTAPTKGALTADKAWVGGVEIKITATNPIEITGTDANGDPVTLKKEEAGGSGVICYMAPGREVTVKTSDGSTLKFTQDGGTTKTAVNASTGVPSWIKAGGAQSAKVTVTEDVEFTNA